MRKNWEIVDGRNMRWVERVCAYRYKRCGIWHCGHNPDFDKNTLQCTFINCPIKRAHPNKEDYEEQSQPQCPVPPPDNKNAGDSELADVSEQNHEDEVKKCPKCHGQWIEDRYRKNGKLYCRNCGWNEDADVTLKERGGGI